MLQDACLDQPMFDFVSRWSFEGKSLSSILAYMDRVRIRAAGQWELETIRGHYKTSQAG